MACSSSELTLQGDFCDTKSFVADYIFYSLFTFNPGVPSLALLQHTSLGHLVTICREQDLSLSLKHYAKIEMPEWNIFTEVFFYILF